MTLSSPVYRTVLTAVALALAVVGVATALLAGSLASGGAAAAATVPPTPSVSATATVTVAPPPPSPTAARPTAGPVPSSQPPVRSQAPLPAPTAPPAPVTEEPLETPVPSTAEASPEIVEDLPTDAPSVTRSAAPSSESNWNKPISKSATPSQATDMALSGDSGGGLNLPVIAGLILLLLGGVAFAWWAKTGRRTH